MAHMAASNSLWIRSPKFDLSLIMGGALFTFFVAGLAAMNSSWLPLLFWIWIVVFEGSHFWATLSRTYLDRKYRQENMGILIGSLIFFALPAIMVGMNQSWPASNVMGLYGLFIFVWSLYHNARQHYGFVSIYSKKAGLSDKERVLVTWALYASVCAAQFYFLFNYKLQNAFNAPATSSWAPVMYFIVHQLPVIISVLAALLLIQIASRAWSLHEKKGLVPFVYVGICFLFYSGMFYLIAPREPFYSSASNGAQQLMLIAIMNSLFHNIQYHAIVWHYGQARYSKGENNSFRAAAWVNGKTLNYIFVALALGLVFAFVVWNLGDWPGIGGSTPAEFSNWAYIVFFGIIGHHFYLDQKIWRPSQQTELRGYLRLNERP